MPSTAFTAPVVRAKSRERLEDPQRVLPFLDAADRQEDGSDAETEPRAEFGIGRAGPRAEPPQVDAVAHEDAFTAEIALQGLPPEAAYDEEAVGRCDAAFLERLQRRCRT